MLDKGIRLISSYHPSQQNTQTGKLTEAMFDDVFRKARRRLCKVGCDSSPKTFRLARFPARLRISNER